jgi:hypothetical protein
LAVQLGYRSWRLRPRSSWLRARRLQRANGDVTAPPGSATYGWISTAGGVNGVGQLPSIGGTDGSTFTTNPFAANSGDVLSYEFNFVTSDGQDGAGQFIYEDYAYVQLLDAATNAPVALLFDARTEPAGLIVPGAGLPPIDPGVTLIPPSAPVISGSGTQGNLAGGPVWAPLGSYSGWCWGAGCGYTGWIKSNYSVAAGGTYKLQFGVTNWGDTIYDTGLAYSGIQVGGRGVGDGVPEPASWAMMLTGVAGLGALARRARRNLFAV